MRVWLITVGEPLVIDQGGARLLRTGILADLLVRNGHSVVFWSSTFDHVKKQHRAGQDAQYEVEPGYQIRLLHSLGYRSNVSLRRILNHCGVARKFREQASATARPDVILCSLPTLELCTEAVNFGHRERVPVVLDIRDLWPDLFLDLFPPSIRGVGRLLLNPMFRQIKTACSAATAITGSTEEYVSWGLGHADRSPTHWDRHFPMAYVESSPTSAEISRAESFWQSYGLSEKNGEFIVCWFGMIGRHSELNTVIDAARILYGEGKKVRIVLCGVGPGLENCRRLAQSTPNVMLPGWVNAAQIWKLLRLSSVGLAPYVSNQNYICNIPNKPIEYLSAGLPVVSSLQGALHRLLTGNDCGITYDNGNPRQLAQALSDLRDQPSRRAAMSDNAQQLFREQFVAENVYQQMQSYLEEMAYSHADQLVGRVAA